MAGGVALATVAAVTAARVRAQCIEEFGAAATCAAPQIYFEQGLFAGGGSCGWRHVQRLECRGQVDTFNGNSTGVIRQMASSLTLVDLRDNAKLRNLPLDFAMLSALERLRIADSGVSLPYSVCRTGSLPAMTLLDVAGSETETHLDWSSQRVGDLALREECLDFAPRVRRLNVSDAGIGDSVSLSAGLGRFVALEELDGRRNNITRMFIKSDNIIEIIARGGRVLFHENPTTWLILNPVPPPALSGTLQLITQLSTSLRDIEMHSVGALDELPSELRSVRGLTKLTLKSLPAIRSLPGYLLENPAFLDLNIFGLPINRFPDSLAQATQIETISVGLLTNNTAAAQVLEMLHGLPRLTRARIQMDPAIPPPATPFQMPGSLRANSTIRKLKLENLGMIRWPGEVLEGMPSLIEVELMERHGVHWNSTTVAADFSTQLTRLRISNDLASAWSCADFEAFLWNMTNLDDFGLVNAAVQGFPLSDALLQRLDRMRVLEMNLANITGLTSYAKARIANMTSGAICGTADGKACVELPRSYETFPTVASTCS